MNTIIKSSRSVVVAGAMATLAVAAMGFAGSAQARDNVYWSVGVGTPGAVVNVGNAGVYQQPVYVQPQPVYIQPQPVYVQPAPVYYQPRPVFVRPSPVYLAPQPVYYGRPYGHHWRHRGNYEQGRQNGYGPGYAPVYYQRDGRGGHEGNQWHDGRR
ncbi:MAG: hypothetical protein I8H71_14745 [Xanthomonadaceae bacterium]|nr:hypothetical protein [Xanthomonadaceae bacterium]